MKAKVYFCKEISPENVVRLYEALGRELTGRVAAKVHSGEAGNQNFLRPAFWKPIIDKTGATIVECNTAYEGARDTTAKHRKLFSDHEWTRYFGLDLLDAEGPDLRLPVASGHILKENIVGKNIRNYDALLVLSHFKGHPMGGYGGALKQLSIGCASTAGKCNIHTAGRSEEVSQFWNLIAEQDDFLAGMAEAAKTVLDLFTGKTAFINVMANLSVDCDCCAVAEDPCMKDIGILSSLDPVAIDQACIDLIYASDDPGKPHFIERVESRHGIHTIEAAADIGCGVREYELIEL